MRYETTYGGVIEDARGRAIPCPRCGQSSGHTVSGQRGGKGRLRCRRGHSFNYPAGVDARQRLEQSITDPRRNRTR